MAGTIPSEAEATRFLSTFSVALRQVFQAQQQREEAEKKKAKSAKPAPRKLTPKPVSIDSVSDFPSLSASVKPKPRKPNSQQELKASLPEKPQQSQPANQPPKTPSDGEDQKQRDREEEKPKPLDPAAIEKSALYHETCARIAPLRVCDTLLDLLQAARVAVPAKGDVLLKWKAPPPVYDCVDCFEALRLYARKALPKLCDFLYAYPTPVADACASSTFQTILPTAKERTFPLVNGEPPWTPPLPRNLPAPAVLRDERGLDLPNKLSINLERAWDQVLWLHRQYIGEVSTCKPGVLHVKTALFTMAALHPANMDVFAYRLVDLMSQSALQAHDATPKMRQLSARLHSAGGAGSTEGRSAGGKTSGKPKPKGGTEEGVVLHRLPQLVREMFGDDPNGLFFLDFVTAVDSAKLYVALIPRLSAALSESITAASAATSNASFTDAIMDARLYAKFLCVAMNANNWAHSPHSLSGGLEVKSNKRPGLGTTSLKWRSPIHAATWVSVFDVETKLESAVKSNQLLAVTTMVAVSAAIIHLASFDPVAASSEWYMRCLHALRDLRVQSSPSNDDNVEEQRPGMSMPLLSAMIGEVLNSSECVDQVSKLPEERSSSCITLTYDEHDWRTIGDARLIRECCPTLEEFRKLLLLPGESTESGQKVIARRVTPLPKAKAVARPGIARVNGEIPGTGATKPAERQEGSITEVEVAPSGSRVVETKTEITNPQSIPYAANEEDKTQDTRNVPIQIDEKEDKSNIQAALHREFYTRMDGRLRELIGVVVSSEPTSHDAALRRYTDVAKLLYPKTPETVIAVAGHICADRAVRELKLKRRRVNKNDTKKNSVKEASSSTDDTTGPSPAADTKAAAQGTKEEVKIDQHNSKSGTD